MTPHEVIKESLEKIASDLGFKIIEYNTWRDNEWQWYSIRYTYKEYDFSLVHKYIPGIKEEINRQIEMWKKSLEKVKEMDKRYENGEEGPIKVTCEWNKEN